MAGEQCWLGYWRQQPEAADWLIHKQVAIDDQRYNELVAAAATYRALSERPAFQIVVSNYHQIRDAHAAYANVERIGGAFRFLDTRAMVQVIASAVTNWLTSTRLYLESDRDYLLGTFGKHSPQLRRHHEATSRAFDTYTGYRFLYNLRDFAQHCGPPITGVTVSRDDTSGRVLDIYLDRTALLTSRFKWSTHARALLDTWPDDKISLLPMLDEAMDGLRLVEREMRTILLQHCAAAVPTLQTALDELGPVEGQPAVFRLPDTDADEVTFTYQSLPSAQMLGAVLDTRADAETPDGEGAKPAPNAAEVARANSDAAAVVAVWLAHDASPQLTDAINTVLGTEHGLDRLTFGLLNLTGTLLHLAAKAFASSPDAVLGGLVAAQEPDDVT